MNRKTLTILRERLKRLKIEMKMRHEDDTLAFFLPLEDKIQIFLDVWAEDTYEWWKKLGKRMVFDRFVIKSLSRTYLHEIIHWASDEATDEQCELMAIELTFGSRFVKELIEE